MQLSQLNWRNKMSKQNRIISEIKTILNSLPQLNIVGEYPTDIDNIGNNTNVVLIKGGDESYISSPGKRYEVTFDIKLYIVTIGNSNEQNGIRSKYKW